MDPAIIPFSELDPNPGRSAPRHSHEFLGEEHGGVPFSVILVHTGPGGGPAVHRHPYAEVFIVESGEATFTLGVEASLSLRPVTPRPLVNLLVRSPGRGSLAPWSGRPVRVARAR